MFPRIPRARNVAVRRLLVVCSAFCAVGLPWNPAWSQGPRSPLPNLPGSSDKRDAKDLFSQMPVPPPGLRKLIEAGSVRLESGPQRLGPEYDARLTGKTRYHIAYHYSSRSQWRVDRARGQLIITVRYTKLSWKPSHVIWLRDLPPTAETWSDQTLLHEFDHVRISNDSRLSRRFTEMLKGNPVIRHDLKPGENFNRAMVDRIVEDHVDAVFQELADLIAIRYQELDRDTSHGANELPESSGLYTFLRGGERKRDDPAVNQSN